MPPMSPPPRSSTSLRPRIVAPVYGSAEHIRSVSGLATSAGRPLTTADTLVAPVSSTHADHGSGTSSLAIYPLTDAASPDYLPRPYVSDPALLSDRGQRKDIAFDDQVNRMEWEVEREREAHRIVAGLDTRDFYALLRSFDKQVQQVRLATAEEDYLPPGLDLHPDPKEELSVVKVRNSLERFYSSVGMGLLRLFREVQRIRNWEDPTRSSMTLSVYAYAWWCNLIIASILSFISILVLVPSSRRWFFESAAHRVKDKHDGQAAQDIISQRTRNEWGPAAVENSAAEWAQGVQEVVSSMAAGHDTTQEKEARKSVNAALEDKIQDDLDKQDEAGQDDSEDKNRTKTDLAVRLYAQPAMRVVAGLADKWERLEHVLQPKGHVYRSHRRHAVFFQLLLPALLVSVFVSEKAVSQVAGFVFGFLLFGQPLISHIISDLDRSIPGWKSKMILELNLFETSPTHAQLVLGTLRDAEHRRNPLPPAPHPDDDLAVARPHSDDESDSDDTAAEGKRKQIVEKLSDAGAKGKDTTRAKARKAWDKLGKAKEEGFAVMTGHRKMDIQGKAEHMLDKLHISKDHRLVSAALSHMPTRPTQGRGETACSFYAWHKKHGPGHIVIHPRSVSGDVPARIEFSRRKVRAVDNTALDPSEEPSSGHQILPIDDIIGLKKVGLSTIKRTALSWALDSEGAGGTGLEVTRRVAGGGEETVVLTSIVRRDELFNRLVALGTQRWVVV